MRLLTVAETAARWDVNATRVRQLIAEGRVPRAAKFGKAWSIPSDVAKPKEQKRGRRPKGKATPPRGRKRKT